MKKFFLSLVAAIVAATATYAQSSLVATLSHNGETTQFYGANALVESHEAAADGDVITLSSGTFSATTVTKCITLRGAGMFGNSNTQVLPTTISGIMTFGISADAEGRLIIEGLCFNNDVYFTGTLKNPLFEKTIFQSSVRYNVNNLPTVITPTYIHCFAKSSVYNKTNNTFINCVLGFLSCDDNYYNTYENCVVITNQSPAWSYVKNQAFKNCILVSTDSGTSYGLDSSCSAYNCLAIYNGLLYSGAYIFKSVGNNTNTEIKDNGSSVFKTYTGTFTDSETFELKDEAASTYLGHDGTQVGIYGGTAPFDPTPSNPQVTKFEVNSGTANGKLTVKINVE